MFGNLHFIYKVPLYDLEVRVWCAVCVCVCVCVCVYTKCVLDAGLLATSQYLEGPVTGHLDTGFSWFPCAYKQMLRWFTRFQVATICFSYTGCRRRNVPDFGRVFLRSYYTDITQNTYIQSSMVTEILAREKCGLLWCLRSILCP